jgi:hypothetical protein
MAGTVARHDESAATGQKLVSMPDVSGRMCPGSCRSRPAGLGPAAGAGGREIAGSVARQDASRWPAMSRLAARP